MTPPVISDLSYFIDRKRKTVERMTAEGKDTSALEREIQTLEGFSEMLKNYIIENTKLGNTLAELERENKELLRYREVAIGVSAARKWAVATGKSSAKIFQMLEENPSHFEDLFEDLKAYNSDYLFFIEQFETTKDYYNEENRNIYGRLCEKGGFEVNRRLANWKTDCDRRRKRATQEEEIAEGKALIDAYAKIIPELKELFR